MACPPLLQLPVELLRAILLRLPSTAALAFILTCHSIYTACNDWTAWRDLVATQPTLAHSYRTLLRRTTDRNTWKRYVVADALATRYTPLDSKDVERWLPHIVALYHPILWSTRILSLHRLCDPICSAPIVSGGDVDPETQAESLFALSPSRAEDTHTWRLAQAASFCLSTHLLASLSGEEEPPCLLQSAQWFRVTNYRGLDVGARDTVHHLVMLHALANRALSLFCRELRWALANGGMSGPPRARLVSLPTTRSLPLATLCATPVPFAADSLARFSTCHLPAMTEPGFFIDDEWTGCSSLGPAPSPGPRTRFAGVGGDDEDDGSNIPSPVEQVIRWRLVQQWDSGNKYLLQSNCFHMHCRHLTLKVTVDRATGHLKIAHNYAPRLDWEVLDAVMTPFGIVEAVHPRGYWTWFWKCKWSETIT